MNSTKMKPYQAPRLTMAEFKMERGFAISPAHALGLTALCTDDDRALEERSASSGSWAGNDW